MYGAALVGAAAASCYAYGYTVLWRCYPDNRAMNLIDNVVLCVPITIGAANHMLSPRRNTRYMDYVTRNKGPLDRVDPDDI